MALKIDPQQKKILSDYHWRALHEGSGLSKETIDAAGIWSAKAEDVKALLDIDPRSGGIVFPYPGCGDYVRIRLDTPYAGPGYDKPAKYLSKPKSGNRLYIPTILPTSKELLIITEGEKKALKACQEGIPCIATSGVWSWKNRNEYGEKQDDFEGLIQDFDRLDLGSKELIVLVYDSDINQLHPAWSAYGRLAEQLYARGAKQVKIVCLPDLVKDGKTGLDDYFLRRKPKDFLDLIEHTPTWLPSGDGAKPFAERQLQVIMERVNQEQSIDAVYSTEALEALTSLYLLAETEYARAKQVIMDTIPPRKKIDVRALNKQVKSLADITRKRQNYNPLAMTGPQAPVELPELPIKLRQPRGWSVTERGVIFEGSDGAVVACPVPIILTRRLRHITTGDERIELSYRRDGDWHKVTANRSTVFNRTAIISLTDKGLPVSSESARHLVRYLAELEAENLDVLPLTKATTKMGWLEGTLFLPGNAPGIVLDVEDGSATLADAYHASGSFEEWKKAMEPVRRSTIGRFILAAGFAAPLLRLLNHRVFIIHNWGPSRGGKTAVTKAALSPWGDPEELLTSFNATKVGIERLAAFYNDLPLGIDERQVIENKQGFIESLVYLLSLGKGKARGTKSGGLQPFASWRTIILTNGEEPLSSETSQTGVRTRTLEIRGIPLDENEAQMLHIALNEHYGHAGPMFIQRVIQELKKDPNFFKDDYDSILEELQKKATVNIRSHVSAVAVVAMADCYSAEWIFGIPGEQAFEEALKHAEEILGMLETTMEADIVTRAWEFVQGWIAAYADKFKDNCQPPRYGFEDVITKRIYIITDIFEEALRKEGYSPRAILQGFAERGLIETFPQEGTNKRRFKIQKRWDGKRPWFVVIHPNEDGSEANDDE